jgi:hypothetical protein
MGPLRPEGAKYRATLDRDNKVVRRVGLHELRNLVFVTTPQHLKRRFRGPHI